MDRDVIVFEDPLQSEKNKYYRDAFRNIMRIVNIQAVLILILTLLLAFYVNTKEDHNRYFAETLEGGKVQMTGLSYPNMGKMTITSWTAQAATQIMTFGFNDVDERFSLSVKNFTPRGWESFYKAMIRSKVVEKVIEAQQIITAIPRVPPELVQEGLINGVYSWVFDADMLITFRAGSVKKTERKVIRIVVEKVPTSDNPNGVGISEWYIY